MKSFDLFRSILKNNSWGVHQVDDSMETIEVLTGIQLRNLPIGRQK